MSDKAKFEIGEVVKNKTDGKYYCVLFQPSDDNVYVIELRILHKYLLKSSVGNFIALDDVLEQNLSKR